MPPSVAAPATRERGQHAVEVGLVASVVEVVPSPLFFYSS